MIVIVGGVAGTGKTTVGTLLAKQLGWQFADADKFHSQANVAKMRAGIPLTDEDREPWLRAIADWMDGLIAAGQSGVVTCSALRRSFRDELLSGRPAARMFFLEAPRDVLVQRLTSRHGHFFHEPLLDSQLQTLEPPQPGERVVTLDADDEADHIVAEIAARLEA